MCSFIKSCGFFQSLARNTSLLFYIISHYMDSCSHWHTLNATGKKRQQLTVLKREHSRIEGAVKINAGGCRVSSNFEPLLLISALLEACESWTANELLFICISFFNLRPIQFHGLETACWFLWKWNTHLVLNLKKYCRWSRSWVHR